MGPPRRRFFGGSAPDHRAARPSPPARRAAAGRVAAPRDARRLAVAACLGGGNGERVAVRARSSARATPAGSGASAGRKISSQLGSFGNSQSFWIR